MGSDRPRRLRLIFFWTVVILGALYLIGTVVGGIGLGWIALHPPRNPIVDSEERMARSFASHNGDDFRDIQLSAADGIKLRAWFFQPRDWNGNAAILLHGVSDNRLGVYGYGKWLLKNHYAVLLPDARGHGLSGGVATYGLSESDDIRRWIDWIETNDHPGCVFGLGESMGAAELLQSLPKEHRFCAVVAECPFASFREVAYARFGRQFHAGPWLGETFFRPTIDVGLLYVRFHYGFDMERASPVEAVRKSNVPVLLIHGLADSNIPPFHSREIQAANPRVALWEVAGAVHTGAHAVAPQEFERRILEWFESHSPAGNDSTSQ